MNNIKLYGKLEMIATDSSPTRSDMFFLIGTLAKKHSAEEIIDVINHRTQWSNYEIEHFEKMVCWVKKKQNQFFSPLKKKATPKSSTPKTWFFNKGFARSPHENELCLDLDDHESWNRAVDLFDSWKLTGNCRTWIGAKGGHISIFLDKKPSESFKRIVRNFFNADLGQINCTVEGKPHQKTGNLVQVIREESGTFSSDELIKRIKEVN